mgnify:CR=1 FL=1
MPNHGIEFDGRECTSKRDVEGRLAIIRFEANTSQLICVEVMRKKFKKSKAQMKWNLPSNIPKSIDSLKRWIALSWTIEI